MGCYYKSNRVKITHLPTGLTSESDYLRSQHKNRLMALAHLKSKFWAYKNGLGPSSDIVVDCVLPDDEPFPHDLLMYRRPIGWHLK